MVGTWQRLAHVELSSNASSINSGTFTAKENIRIIFSGVGTNGSSYPRIQFNSDTANNYDYRQSIDGGSDNIQTSQNHINTTGNVGAFHHYFEADVTNVDGKRKLVIVHGVDSNTSGAGNAPQRREVVGRWTTTSGQITSVQVTDLGSNNFASGAYITVLGASEDVVTDEKQTLADATSDITQVAGTSDITDLTWTQTVGSSTSDTFYVLKDTSNDLMDIKAAGNCGTESNPSIAYATLSEALGTTYWRMRFKLVFNTVTAESTGGKSFYTNFFIVDNGAVWDTSENGFGFRFIADAGSSQTQFYSMTSGTSSGTTMSWTPSSNSTIYVEISWEDGTATANFYSDSGYSNRVSSTTANATRSGTFSGLKFPQIVLRQDDGGNGVMEIDMSNLEIINRVSAAPNVGTQFRETDTRKIYRWKAESSVDATYTEDMSDTTGWSFADTNANNVTGGSLSYNVKRDGSNDAASYDLGSTISDTKFVLRFSRTITNHSHTSGSNCIAFMGLSDNTSGQGTSQDFIGFNFASNDVDGATYKDNTTLVASAVTPDPSWTKLTSGTYYYELKRTSATSVTWTVYTDSDFSTVHRTETDTIPSSITGLRYFKFANWHSSGSGSCNVTGTIDDIQVWDGVDSATSSAQWVERGTA